MSVQKKKILIASTLFVLSPYTYGVEQFHPEIAFERNLNYPIYDLSIRADFMFDPLDLLVWSRFDIIAKYIYTYYREMGFHTDWALRLYIEHLRIWGFQEWDDSKHNLEDFLMASNETIDSIKENGFNPHISKIRIDDRKIPCEGSHRIGACLFFKNKIICYYDPKGIPPRATMSSSMFFRKYTKYVELGLEEKYLDDMSLHYAKLKKNTYIIILFPVAQGYHDDIRRILRMYGNIVYEKFVKFTENGQLNFIRELYEDAPWLGSFEDHFAGTQQEVYHRFKAFENDENMRVWLVELNTQGQKNNCEQTIKNFFNNEHAIYCSNDHRETIRLGKILFVANSIEFLNKAVPAAHEQLDQSLSKFKKMLRDHNLDEEFLCIVGDAVKAAYGKQDCSQLKFICTRRLLSRFIRKPYCIPIFPENTEADGILF